MNYRRHIACLALVACGLVMVALAFRQGAIPARYSPLPRIDLAAAPTFLVDWQLSELKTDRDLCTLALRAPHVHATPIEDEAPRSGCGWGNAVRLTSVSSARMAVGQLSCPMAAALALWLQHDVQPRALSLLGERVISVQHMGAYSCRNIIGSAMLSAVRSQHATANAIDISGFTLASGRRIKIKDKWATDGADGKFLREIHRQSCRLFRVALSPDYNAAHHDHFHLDRGPLSRCV